MGGQGGQEGYPAIALYGYTRLAFLGYIAAN